MSDAKQSGERVPITRASKGYLDYPVRLSRVIPDSDWNRWVKNLHSIKEHNPVYREMAYAGFGIGVSCLIGGVTTLPSIASLPGWVCNIYFIVGGLALSGAALCLHFDRKLQNVETGTIETVLEDMAEVRERSPQATEGVPESSPIDT